nr:Uncharacterised protein [Streptococcus thermophilus]
MDFDLLRHPAVSVMLSVLSAVIVAVATAAGLGAFNPDDTPHGNYGKAQLVSIPADAKTATPEQVDTILTSKWLPDPGYDSIPLGFEALGDKQSAKRTSKYVLNGEVCNGFGVILIPNRATGTFTTKDAPQTVMGCEQRKIDYEAAINESFHRGNTFYVENATTVYVGKNGKGLRLTKAA